MDTVLLKHHNLLLLLLLSTRPPWAYLAVMVVVFVVPWVPLKKKKKKKRQMPGFIYLFSQGAGFTVTGLWELAAGFGGCRHAGSGTAGVKLLR